MLCKCVLYIMCTPYEHLKQAYVPLVVNTSRSFPHSWLITRFVTRLTRRMPLVEQELLSLPEHISSAPVYSGVRVTRPLDLCVCFVDHCLSFYPFSSGHCVVCSSSIYGFWLPLWYLQTLLLSSCNKLAANIEVYISQLTHLEFLLMLKYNINSSMEIVANC